MNKSLTVHSGVRKILATMMTQAVILGLSVITGFVLPGHMGPEMFGYWQIYIFYLAYLNLFGLGFNDGIALHYGGYEYEKLPYRKLSGGIRVFSVYLTIITVVLLITASFIKDTEIRAIYYILVLSVPNICMQCIVLTVFLSVNRTGLYNLMNLMTKTLSVLLCVLLILYGTTSFRLFMYADFITRVFSTIVCIILGRRFLFGDGIDLQSGMQELKEKSKSGIHITIAVIAASFMPVAGRIAVEWNESVSVYGMYSFAMSLLAIVITFTNAAGTVIFPMLKRLPEDGLPDYYRKFSVLYDSLIYIAFLLYVPAVLIIQYRLNEYLPVLDYLYILLAMCLPLGKIQLLVTSYYKAFRLEKAFLAANLMGAGVMLLATFGSYYAFRSLTAVAICTTSLLTFWCFAAEAYLVRRMHGHIRITDWIIPACLMTAFILGGSFRNLWMFLAIYGTVLAAYLLLNGKKLVKLARIFRA